MHVHRQYHICRTGKTGQYYTLYVTTNVMAENFNNSTCAFVQNLGLNDDESLMKVKAMITIDKADSTEIDFHNSKRREYCELTAFGFGWKKTEKGFVTDLVKYAIDPIRDVDIDTDTLSKAQRHNQVIDSFWVTWKENKQAMKDSGFSVFKSDAGNFKLFFKNCSNDEMFQKMRILETVHEVTGSYIGEQGHKVENIPVTVEKVYNNTGYYGDVQNIVFKTLTGDCIKTKYTGKKFVFQEVATITISGTIIDNQIQSLVKTTIIIRVKVLK